MASKDETETTVTAPAGLPVRIWTNVKRDLTRLRADDRVTEVNTWDDGAEFEIPEGQYSPVTGLKRQRAPLTDDQREQIANRLTEARAKRGT